MDYSTQPTAVVPSQGRLTLNRQFPLGEPATVEAINSPDPDNHPNFIESNTQAITLEELSGNLIPTLADNSLTISHTNFIKTVRTAAEQVFGNLTPDSWIARNFLQYLNAEGGDLKKKKNKKRGLTI